MLCAIGVAISMALLGMSRNYIQTEQMPSTSAYRFLFLKPVKAMRANGICVEPEKLIKIT